MKLEKPTFTKHYPKKPWIYNHLKAELSRIVKEQRIIEFYKRQPKYDSGEHDGF